MPGEVLSRVVVVEVVLSAADAASPLNLKAFVDFSTWEGVPVASQVRDVDDDGSPELVVSFSGNPFTDRRSFALLLAPETTGNDGGVIPALKVTTRLYATISPGGATQTVVIAQGETTETTSLSAIRLGGEDSSVNVDIQCVNADFCNFQPGPDGGTVNVDTNVVNITVTRRASCPTSQFVGDLYVFLLPNPLATPVPDRKGAVQVGFDFTEPISTTFTVNDVPLGTYYAIAVLDVGGEFGRNNFAFQDLDIINALPIPVDVTRGAAANVTVTLDEVVGRGSCSGESPPTVTVRRLANCGAPGSQVGNLWIFAQGSNGSVSTMVGRTDLTSQVQVIPDSQIPPLPAGSYVLTAALDVNPTSDTSFTPGDGDLLSSPVSLTVPSQEPPLVTLDQVVGGSGCTDGINVSGTVVGVGNQPIAQATVRVFEIANGRERYALSLGDGTFNFPGVDASLGYDLSVLQQGGGGGLDGMVSWLGVPATMTTPRAAVAPPAGRQGGARFATLNATINSFGAEVILASNYFDMQRIPLPAQTPPQTATFNVNWDGPASIPVVVAMADGDPATRFTTFEIRSLSMTSGATLNLSFAATPPVPAARTVTVTATPPADADGAPVIYPMIELNGIRLPFPRTSTSGIFGTTTQLVPPTDCPGCVQYIALKAVRTEFAGQGRCFGVSEDRVEVPAGATTITSTMPDFLTFVSPTLAAAGQPPTSAPRPVSYELAPHTFPAVWMFFDGQGDSQTKMNAFNIQNQGSFPEMVSLGLRVELETARIMAMGISDGQFTPEGALRDGRLGFDIPFSPCSSTEMPDRRLGPGVQTALGITEVTVVR